MSEKNDKGIDLLMQSRQLVHTSYEVTAIQNRIFYYCLLTAQKEKNGELSCTVKVEDIKKLIPNKNQRTLANIKKIIQTLKQTSLEFEKREEDDIVECDYNLIAGSEYFRNKEIFKIKLSDRLYRHLIDYTVYAPLNLDILTKFKSFYSQRLYELLRLWSRTDTVVVKSFKLDQLRFILGVEDKYPEYKNFKQRVLDQATKEIKQSGKMEVDFEPIKNSRKVEAIEFKIYDYEKKVYFKNSTTERVVEELTAIDSAESNEDISLIRDFYVPNKKIFTNKTLENFKQDFKNYDFSDKVYKKLLQEAIIITLDQDDEEKLKVKSYDFFKKTLENKINDYSKKTSRNYLDSNKKVYKSNLDKYKEKCDMKIEYNGEVVSVKNIGSAINDLVEERNNLTGNLERIVNECMTSREYFEMLSPISKKSVIDFLRNKGGFIPGWIK